MSSNALIDLLYAVDEIDVLLALEPTEAGHAKLEARRLIGRSSVVLLSSHLERYVYAVFEEFAEELNRAQVPAAKIPLAIRLRHAQSAIDDLSDTGWENRASQLAQFAESDAGFWDGGRSAPQLDHERLLRWMKSPKPKNLVRVYAAWGLPDIFDAITRTPHNRQRLWLQLDTLVAKRNNIAHGDIAEQASPSDVRRFRASVTQFCSRSDRQLIRLAKRDLGMLNIFPI